MSVNVTFNGSTYTIGSNQFACLSSSYGPSLSYCVTGDGQAFVEGGISTPGAEIMIGTMNSGTASSLLSGFSCSVSAGEGVYLGGMADLSGDSATYIAYGGSTPLSGGCSYGYSLGSVTSVTAGSSPGTIGSGDDGGDGDGDYGDGDYGDGGGDYGDGGGCVEIGSFLPGGGLAGAIVEGSEMQLSDESTLEPGLGIVTYSKRKSAQGFRVTTKSGASLVCSDTAPIPTPKGLVLAPQLLGCLVAVRRDDPAIEMGWELVEAVEPIGLIEVQHITVGDKCFWAGERHGTYLLHHNLKVAREASPHELQFEGAKRSSNGARVASNSTSPTIGTTVSENDRSHAPYITAHQASTAQIVSINPLDVAYSLMQGAMNQTSSGGFDSHLTTTGKLPEASALSHDPIFEKTALASVKSDALSDSMFAWASGGTGEVLGSQNIHDFTIGASTTAASLVHQCVHVDSVLPSGLRAGDVEMGSTLELADSDTLEPGFGIVTYSETKKSPGVRITTSGGVSLICSDTAPIVTSQGLVLAPQLLGKLVAARRGQLSDGLVEWHTVVNLEFLAEIDVQHITVGDKCFWAGEKPNEYLLHHNQKMPMATA